MSKEDKTDIILIVEGYTDQVSLKPFEGLYSPKKVSFHIMGSDITSKFGIDRNNIIKTLQNSLCKFISSEKILPKSILCIIQIMDTDGAYVPDTCVVYDSSLPPKKTLYDKESIRSNNPEDIKKRNFLKRSLMDRMSGLPYICIQRTKIPYRCFYLSRNLEHIIHNRIDDLTKQTKLALAKCLSKTETSPSDFKNFFFSEDIMVAGNHKETWDYLCLEATNSLQRKSNLHLSFQFIENLLQN